MRQLSALIVVVIVRRLKRPKSQLRISQSFDVDICQSSSMNLELQQIELIDELFEFLR